MRLYKYVRALEIQQDCGDQSTRGIVDISVRLDRSIRESRIYFSHPAAFNDPLECTVPVTIENYQLYRQNYLEYLGKIISERIGDRENSFDRSRRIHEACEYGMPIENCLVYCFTRCENNRLMWSHYADQNRGICLCYEFPDSNEELEQQIIWSDQIAFDSRHFGMQCLSRPVVYERVRPSLHISNTSSPIEQWKFDNDYALIDAIFTKTEEWSYEQEWRLALVLPLRCEKAFPAGIDIGDYYSTLPKEWLKGIIFGLRLDENYCNRIRNIVDESGYVNVEYRKARMAHGEVGLIYESY